MEKNKIIIIALIVVIAVLLVGIFAMMPNETKKDTKLEFKSNATLTQGDPIKIRLTDSNGTVIANQKVNVTVTDENKSSDYHSVETNAKGVGTLKMDKGAGKYEVIVTYGGNDNYTGCNATEEIEIEEAVAEEPVTQQSSESSSSSSGIHYDSDLNVYYNDEGVIVDPDGKHQQGVGTSYSAARDAKDRWDRGEPVMV